MCTLALFSHASSHNYNVLCNIKLAKQTVQSLMDDNYQILNFRQQYLPESITDYESKYSIFPKAITTHVLNNMNPLDNFYVATAEGFISYD